MEPSNDVAEASEAQAAPKPATILLRVLSPSTEIPDKLTFPLIDTNTTVGELKIKIQDVVPTRPAPDRQRLIYRGFPLIDNELSLREVFGEEAIKGSDALSLHLVLPPALAPATSAARSYNPFHAQNTSSLPPRPASTGQLPASLNASDVRPPQHPFAVNGVMTGAPQNAPPLGQQANNIPNIPLNPHMQHLFNTHLAAITQQLGGQINQQIGGQVPPQAQAQINEQVARQLNQQLSGQTSVAPVLQQAIGVGQNLLHHRPWNAPALPPQPNQAGEQQQQVGDAAGPHDSDNSDPSHQQNQDTATPSLGHGMATPPNGIPMQSNGVGNTSTVIHEGQGPNGNQWRMVINASTTASLSPGTSSQGNGLHRANPQASNTLPLANTNLNQAPQIPGPPHNFRAATNTVPSRPPWSTNPFVLMQERMSMLEMALDNGGAPSENDITQTRIQLRNLIAQHPAIHGGLGTALNARLNNLSIRATQARARLISNSGGPSTGVPHMIPNLQSSTESTVYLLSSPAGPQALLLSPSGTYSTSSQSVGHHFSIVPSVLPQQQRMPTPNHVVIQQPNGNQQQIPANLPLPADQAVQQPQPDQARDIARILIPLGGHLWLLIRLFGFVYFVTHGSSWRRTILLGIGAIVIFIMQSGVFRPLQQALLDPIRRHVEGLLPLGGNDRPATRDGVTDLQRGATGQPDPQETAMRLLQERNQRDGNVLRASFRRAERAVALFLASLVPGVGERHIAARDAAAAAEAARQAAEREREEQSRRGPEEATQRDENDVKGEIADGSSAIPVAESSHRSQTPETHSRTPDAQPPLVEI